MTDNTRNRGRLSDKSLKMLEVVMSIANGLRDYWPLTLRQIFYGLVSAMVISNHLREYKKLSALLTKARLAEFVPWDVMEDRARSTLWSGGWQTAGEFIRTELDGFLEGYRRDLLQSQPLALEVWIEKDALSRIAHRAAFPFCVPVVVARGFSSVSYLNECRNRIQRNAEAGKQTLILYAGDLDPSGWAMLPAMMTTLEHEMGLKGTVAGERFALNPEQVERYQLPHSIEAIKATDSRAPKYRARFGNLAVELDALPPATLETLVAQAIQDHLDMGLFQAEQDREAEDRLRLDNLRGQVQNYVGGVAP